MDLSARLNPISSSLRKNCDERSVDCVFLVSFNTNLLHPDKTIFFAISIPKPFAPDKKTEEFA